MPDAPPILLLALLIFALAAWLLTIGVTMLLAWLIYRLVFKKKWHERQFIVSCIAMGVFQVLSAVVLGARMGDSYPLWWLALYYGLVVGIGTATAWLAR